MDLVIEHDGDEIAVMCVGRYTFERVGYYAGCDIVEDFKVFHKNENITKTLPEWQVTNLKEQYLENCRAERCA